jgi:hypothetical protein
MPTLELETAIASHNANPMLLDTTTYQICRGKDLPEKTMFKRVGIVPYFIEDSTPYFLLMVDAKFNEITDAGGISRRREKWSRTASRETREETRGMFNYSISDIETRGVVVYRNDLSIAMVFMHEGTMTRERAISVCYAYQSSYQMGILNNDKKETLENSNMMLLSIQELSNLMKVKKPIIDEADPERVYKVYRPVRFMLRYAFKNFLNTAIVRIEDSIEQELPVLAEA